MPTYTLDGQPLPYGHFSVGADDDAVNYPANVLDLWDDAQLAEIGVERAPDPEPEPGPTPRSEMPKSTVVARLQDIGKFDAVWSILGSNAALFAKWFSPDWPNVYRDDEGMLQVLAAAGLTPAETAQVVA